ncbi:MAG: hypothetical protein QOJ02_3267 [Acidobacteriota bacterium]|jgi:predicted transcriptional regulator|nr:hypothetical protein [Acidobacteriota bacterium]
MSKQKSERFITAFMEIESYIRRLAGSKSTNGKFTPFKNILTEVAKKNFAVQLFEDDLIRYANLRNAISHERIGGKAIAEPHQDTVVAIELIKNKLLAPPTIIPSFRVKVETCKTKDLIEKVTRKMFDGEFSQLPVYENQRFIALLTSETIARWIAKCLTNRRERLEETTIEMVLRYTQDSDNHRLLAKDDTVFQALEAFDDCSRRGKYLDAIIITQRGRVTEHPVGIITIFDFPKLLSLAGQRHEIICEEAGQSKR